MNDGASANSHSVENGNPAMDHGIVADRAIVADCARRSQAYACSNRGIAPNSYERSDFSGWMYAGRGMNDGCGMYAGMNGCRRIEQRERLREMRARLRRFDDGAVAGSREIR